jgi:hypothetical protein
MCHSKDWPPMSESGQSRHFGRRPTTSGLPLETYIVRAGHHVSKVPVPDIWEVADDPHRSCRAKRIGSTRPRDLRHRLRDLAGMFDEELRECTNHPAPTQLACQPNHHLAGAAQVE